MCFLALDHGGMRKVWLIGWKNSARIEGKMREVREHEHFLEVYDDDF